MLIDDLLKRNLEFVQGRAARPLPPVAAVPVAIVACYDPRLDPLLRPALGLADGEGFLLRTAGAVVTPGSDELRSLALAIYLFEVEQVLIVGHTSCRMASFPTDDFIASFRRRGVAREAFGSGDLRHWAKAIATPRAGVLASAAAIAGASFLPPDLAVSGMVLDDESGLLEVVLRPGERPPAAPLPGQLSEPAAGAVAGGSEAAARPPPAEPATAPAPPVPLEALHPVLGTLRVAVEKLAATGGRDDLRRLREALATEGQPVRKLALLQGFVERAAADSPELAKAFALLKRQITVRGGYDLAAKTLIDLFGPLLRGRKP